LKHILDFVTKYEYGIYNNYQHSAQKLCGFCPKKSLKSLYYKENRESTAMYDAQIIQDE